MLIGFTPHKANQPLLSTEFQERKLKKKERSKRLTCKNKENKGEKYMKELIKKGSDKKVVHYNSRLEAVYNIID